MARTTCRYVTANLTHSIKKKLFLVYYRAYRLTIILYRESSHQASCMLGWHVGTHRQLSSTCLIGWYASSTQFNTFDWLFEFKFVFIRFI